VGNTENEDRKVVVPEEGIRQPRSYEKGMLSVSWRLLRSDILGLQSDGNDKDYDFVDEYEETKDQDRANNHLSERSGVRGHFVELLGFASKILFTAQLPRLSLIIINEVTEQNPKQEDGDGPGKEIAIHLRRTPTNSGNIYHSDVTDR
jgi:hypothetical protein